MSLARGRYGIEYNPRQMEKRSPEIGWLLVLIAVAAIISFSVSLLKSHGDVEAEAVTANAITTPPTSSQNEKPSIAEFVQPAPLMERRSDVKRPLVVRNLLMRLADAERRRDLEMAVSTIEHLRSLPGEPAADLDDALARRLGVLNTRRLFKLRNGQWVKEVVVRRGETASRIAAENGSTLASLNCLNGGSVGKLKAGMRLYVMDHPRFSLAVRRRSRIADLSLNGKFFKRYDLESSAGNDGVYALPIRTEKFWQKLGVGFKSIDRTELELMLPEGAEVHVSEL